MFRSKKQETRNKRQEKRSEILEARYESLDTRAACLRQAYLIQESYSINIKYRMLIEE